MGFESPVLLTTCCRAGIAGEAATIMRLLGSSHLIFSLARQLDSLNHEDPPKRVSFVRGSYPRTD